MQGRCPKPLDDLIAACRSTQAAFAIFEVGSRTQVSGIFDPPGPFSIGCYPLSLGPFGLSALVLVGTFRLVPLSAVTTPTQTVAPLTVRSAAKRYFMAMGFDRRSSSFTDSP